MNLLKKFSILATVAFSSLAIAQSASARFVIFVAGNDSATLQRVRTISPTAFATKINDQPAIQAGTFNSEISADSLAIALQQSGLSAQKYFRASEGKESNVPVPFANTIATAFVTPLSTPTSLFTPQQVVIQQTPNQQLVSFPESQPQVFNSVVISQPISTGLSNEQLLPQPTQNTNFRYVAAVPASANNQFLLLRVRQYVPNAFLSNSGRGTYIHAGAYQNRDSAESVSRYLRSQGVDSRVLYF